MAKRQVVSEKNCDPYGLLEDDFDEMLEFLDKKSLEQNLDNINEKVRTFLYFYIVKIYFILKQEFYLKT